MAVSSALPYRKDLETPLPQHQEGHRVPRIARPDLPPIRDTAWQGFPDPVQERHGLVLVVLACVFALAAWAAVLVPAGGAMLWQMQVGARMLGGDLLYREIIDPALPLWYTFGWLQADVSRLTATPAPYLAVAGAAVATLLALWLWDRLTRDQLATGQRRVAWFAITLCLLTLPLGQIGSPAVALMVALFVWTGLVCHRTAGGEPPLWLALTATLVAVPGLLLVPVALAGLLVLEIGLAVKLRRGWHLVRIETVGLAVCTALYTVFVAVTVPDWLPLMQPAPPDFGALASWLIASAPHVGPALLALCGVALTGTRQLEIWLFAGLATFLTLAGLAAPDRLAPEWLAANGLALLALMLLAAGATGPAWRWSGLAGCVAMLALLVGPRALAGVQGTPPAGLPAVATILSKEPADSVAIVLSDDPATASDLPLWYGFGAYGPARAFSTGRDNDRMAERWRATIQCAPPHLLISDVTGSVATKDDPLARLMQDAAFAGWIDTHYARVVSQGPRVFRTRLPAPPAAADCP